MSILDDLPDPTQLSVDSLRQLRDLFQEAAIAAVGDGDVELASWARVVCDRFGFEINARVRGRHELQQSLAEYRAQHPYGVLRFDAPSADGWPS
ncbi:hypothetical protein ACKUVQ_00295 [Mycobacterium seoulense]|uniref:hypothetical protein n=1 Tax=Mycobacterium seoulense TaxID=386911 RepID=UPI003CF51970